LGTWLVPSQILHFFRLKPYKNAIFKEVVQKLKFPNNSISFGFFKGLILKVCKT